MFSKKLFKQYFMVSIIAVLSFFYVNSTLAELGDLYITFPNNIEPGSNFIAKVKIDMSTKRLGGYHMTFLFNPTVLQIVGFLGGSNNFIKEANKSGSFVTANFIGGTTGPDNLANLFQIEFNVIGDLCSQSELTMLVIDVSDPIGTSVPFNAHNTYVDIACIDVQLKGVPVGIVDYRDANIQVTDKYATHYKYSLDDMDFSEPIPIDTPLQLKNLYEGSHDLAVIGIKDSISQHETKATTASWTVSLPTPDIMSVSPSSGPSNGDVNIELTGRFFQPNNPTVFFGDSLAKIVSASDTQIVCTLPEHPPGMVDISVKNPSGMTGTKFQSFTYLPSENGPYQVVFVEPNQSIVAPNAEVKLNLRYTTTDGDNQLTGLGLRFHYNSNDLQLVSVDNVLEEGKQTESYLPTNDTENFDQDSQTDKYFQVEWAYNGWPNTSLPVRLYSTQFQVSKLFKGEDNFTKINLTASSATSTHNFVPTPLNLKIRPWHIKVRSEGPGHIEPFSYTGDVLSFAQDANQEFVMIPNEFSVVQDVWVDGFSIGEVSKHKFSTISTDHTIEAKFIPASHSITVTTIGDGMGFLNPLPGVYKLNHGRSLKISATPSNCSLFKGFSSGDYSTTDSVVTIVADQDKTVQANFQFKTYTITAIAGPHGAISPPGVRVVPYNFIIMYSFMSDECYVVKEIKIDGRSRGGILYHQFNSVMTDHVVEATFKAVDEDKDEILDCIEYRSCTLPKLWDTDGDGLSDGFEDINKNGKQEKGELSPCKADSDSDGILDGWEVNNKINPLKDDSNVDQDNDGYINLYEYANNTSPSEQNEPYNKYYNASMDARRPYQVVSVYPAHQKVAAGNSFIVGVRYSSYLQNNALDGLGIRVHYDSNKLSWKRFSNILSGYVANNEIKIDTENFDDDPATDRYIEISWYDETNKWPSKQLPTDLFTVIFDIPENIPLASSSAIRFSAIKTAKNYNFFSYKATFETQKGFLDLDGNGKEDALSDGLIVMRYLYGYRSDSLISKAISQNAVRRYANEIEPILEGAKNIFDIDGDSSANALSDGLLLVRYLFGLNEADLMKNLINEKCTRCKYDAIVPYIKDMSIQIEPDTPK